MAEQRWLDEVLASSSSTSSPQSNTTPLPRSVRNAPAEMRQAIRRKQNSESARRCRERKKAEELAIQEELRKQKEKLQQLEQRVQSLNTADERRKRRNRQATERRARAREARAKQSSAF